MDITMTSGSSIGCTHLYGPWWHYMVMLMNTNMSSGSSIEHGHLDGPSWKHRTHTSLSPQLQKDHGPRHGPWQRHRSWISTWPYAWSLMWVHTTNINTALCHSMGCGHKHHLWDKGGYEPQHSPQSQTGPWKGGSRGHRYPQGLQWQQGHMGNRHWSRTKDPDSMGHRHQNDIWW